MPGFRPQKPSESDRVTLGVALLGFRRAPVAGDGLFDGGTSFLSAGGEADGGHG